MDSVVRVSLSCYHCSMPKLIDITGKRFGRWRVIARNKFIKGDVIFWDCICDCGKEKPVRGVSLHSGRSNSCGCLNLEVRKIACKTHGYASYGKKSLTYSTWLGMKQRCLNHRHSAYYLYGGRGIKICKKWLAFSGFINDMGEKPSGFSLDRIDPNKGYNKANCRWATVEQQSNNKRSCRYIVFNNEKMTIRQAGRRFGINPNSLTKRLALGWTVEKALKTPVLTPVRTSQ